ncbi:sensor histidine kinase [Sporolactobacillus shoreicorticis]|uniref:histidine kinase n=1 Tax=Sporolactobacillus shoreicorticis TaxID=1923877 RepID=A0ABW5S3F1_9BACL|nr:sensor histidine kinase [Sporolactobacillus shoreicorticis]MCO7126482.1 sensor histidine kinase [Sporolactobacillus shoreicorticis]
MIVLSDYLKERLPLLLSLLFSFTLFGGVFALFEINFWIYALVAVMGLAAVLLCLVFDYRKRRHFFREVTRQFEQLDQKYLIAEVIERPDFAEGEALYDLVKMTDKAMIEAINRYKFTMKDYKEYIELWLHEVKTPLASSQLILENNRSPAADSVRDELEKIERLLEQVLYYARSSDVAYDYVIRTCGLDVLVKQTVQKHRHAFISAHVHLDCGPLDEQVAVDPKWLMFILGQLLTNAIKYRIGSDPRIRIESIHRKNFVALRVIDNGSGISERDLERVFEKGFTGENGRMNGKSTGMGLYLADKLCEKLGFSLVIDSKKGVGTTAIVMIPQRNPYE